MATATLSLTTNVKTKWVNALRRGKYDIVLGQVQFVHVRADGHHTFNGIGVLIDTLPKSLADWSTNKGQVGAFSRFGLAEKHLSIAEDQWYAPLRHPSLFNHESFVKGHVAEFWNEVARMWNNSGSVEEFASRVEKL